MTRSEHAVEVSALSKKYGDFVALSSVSFTVEWGETLALLGPNGAGKSTVIEILEGYRSRTGGTVSVLGQDPEHGTLEWKTRLGIVLQELGEPGNQSVREKLSHFASFYPNPKNVEKLIDAVGLEKKRDTKISKLSGGQKRRLDVALGVVGNPDLLFLDEPTVGFDPAARREFWQLIRELQHEGTTIVLTTHYLDEAAELSDRAAIIARGALVQVAPIDQIGSEESHTPLVRWREEGQWQQVRTHEPGAYVHQLTERLPEPTSLEIIRPTLEDIYLELLGEEQTRDADQPKVENKR